SPRCRTPRIGPERVPQNTPVGPTTSSVISSGAVPTVVHRPPRLGIASRRLGPIVAAIEHVHAIGVEGDVQDVVRDASQATSPSSALGDGPHRVVADARPVDVVVV